MTNGQAVEAGETLIRFEVEGKGRDLDGVTVQAVWTLQPPGAENCD